jgi:TDG/mug DNA glycosylase family protein
VSKPFPVDYPFPTLPDLLAPNLRLVFVGINPSLYAVERGHYFARGSNRFWPAFSRSRLSEPIRAALGRATLTPECDVVLPCYGIGFTDVVKIPSRGIADLRPDDYASWAPRLHERLAAYQPAAACFHGITGYRAFARYVLGNDLPTVTLGPQSSLLGDTRLYVVPNPSGANAHVRPSDQVAWYNRLAEFLDCIDCARPW